MIAALPFLYVQCADSDRVAHTVAVSTPEAPAPAAAPPPAPPPPAPPPRGACDLGPAAPFHVFVLGDFTGQHSNVGGRLAVGGRLDVDGYSLGSELGPGSGAAVTAGGGARIVNSQVRGGGVSARGACETRSIGAPDGPIACQDPRAFNAAEHAGAMGALARRLAGTPDRGCSVTVQEWGAVRIVGTGASSVCTLDLDAAAARFGPSVYNGWVNGVTVDAPGAVVVNVRGDTSIFGKTGHFQLGGGLDAEHLLWNFGDQRRLTISGVGLVGSILAPSAALRFDNGSIQGQVVVASLTGTGQFRRAPFAGELCR